MSKIIVIEGTDCSGKETQTKKLKERLIKEGKKVNTFSFPKYDSPTGKIIGGPFLGKEHITESWFEDPTTVDPKIASLYYAADRKYNFNIVESYLKESDYVILDRYISSNMAHQGSKLTTKEERLKLFKWIENLEYDLLELPKPDITVLLYMPVEYADKLKQNRKELDCHERNIEYLKRSEYTYLELAKIYNYIIINCVDNERIKSIEEIHEEIYDKIKKII